MQQPANITHRQPLPNTLVSVNGQVRRWEAKESYPPQYVGMALQRLLPFQPVTNHDADFKFIDLFAGVGGIRLAFEAIGGESVFTSEWDSYAQRTYMANFGGQHPISGDITKIPAEDMPDHDVLLGGFPCQPFSITGVSKKMRWAGRTALPMKHKAHCFLM